MVSHGKNREEFSSILRPTNSPLKEVARGSHSELSDYNGSRSSADGGPTRGALMPIGKWERAVICERKKKDQD